jgi:ankyrin repeat protein
LKPSTPGSPAVFLDPTPNPPQSRPVLSDAALLERLFGAIAPGEEQAEAVRCLLVDLRRPDLVQLVVERGMLDPNTPLRDDGKMLLHGAAVYGAPGLLRFLVCERGVDPNTATSDGMTALYLAVFKRREESALWLINEAPGCDLNAANSSGFTPLMLAARGGQTRIIKALVARGADVDARDERGVCVLVHAAVKKEEDAALYLLEEAGAAWDVACPKGVNPLTTAAYRVLPRLLRAVVRRMWAEGLGEDEIVRHLMDAADGCIEESCSVASLEALIEVGLDVKGAVVEIEGSKGPFHRRLLHTACLYGHHEAAAFLIERGCDPLGSDSMGTMPHHVAAAAGHLQLLQWLVTTFSIPVDVETTGGTRGLTALHMAALSGQLEVVRWLVGQGADILGRVRFGSGREVRVSELAEEERHDDVAAFLREHEAAAEEAAARRARNEKRREKQKKAKARRRGAAGTGGEGAAGEQAADDAEADGSVAAVGEGEEEQLMEAMAGLAMGASSGAVVAGLGQAQQQQESALAVATEEQQEPPVAPAAPAPAIEHQQQQQQQQQSPPPALAAAPAAAIEQQEEEEQEQEEDDDADAVALAAAIALSLAPAPAIERPPPLQEFLDAHAPEILLCPISLQLMEEPTLLVADGCTYSRVSIEQHLEFCRQRACRVCGCVCVSVCLYLGLSGWFVLFD